MKNLIPLLLTINILTNAQQIDLKLSKTDKTIITTFGMSVTTYGFFKKGCQKKDIYICSTGIMFAALPYIFNMVNKNKRIEINSSGINIKLKYKKFKCSKLPYKKNKYE